MGIQDQVEGAVKALKRSGVTPEAIDKALEAAFAELFTANGHAVARFSAIDLYAQAVQVGFYDEKHQLLRSERRECVVLALLASQQAERNLGLHVFIALMNGISPAEVVNLMFLTGVYCGINVLTNSLRVVAKTFAAIISAAGDPRSTTVEVIKRVMSAFPDPTAAPSAASSAGESGWKMP